jgi:hypothetical protein
MLLTNEFRVLELMLGRSFTLDACCNPEGANSHCQKFCSVADDFLTHDISGETVWLNPPFRDIELFLAHYVEGKKKSPLDTSACILLPRWQAHKWRELLRGMKLIHTYPKGSVIFSEAAREGRVVMKGTPWPVEVWYDAREGDDHIVSAYPVPPPLPVAAVRSVPESGGGEGVHTVMTFRATLQGKPLVAILDSGAKKSFTHSVISSHLVANMGFKTKATRQEVILADGTSKWLEETVTLPLRIQGFSFQQKFHVMDLGENLQVILGDDWLLANKAHLFYDTRTCTVEGKKQRRFTLTPMEGDSLDERSNAPIVNAAQLRRCLKKGYQVTWVRVVDSGVASPTIVQRLGDIECSAPMKEVLLDLQDVFTEQFNCPPERPGITHRIQLEPGAKPPFRPIYRLSPLEMAELEKQIIDLLKRGLIEPSVSPFGAPILFVNKPDGGLRLVQDMRCINALTIKNRMALPRIDQLMDTLSKAK